MSTVYNVSIAGASGYTGMETVRILHGHPNVEIGRLYGASSAGSQFHEQYKAMQSLVELPISDFEELATDNSDAIFLGLPHGKSAEVAKVLLDAGYKGRIIDMSSDFRLKNPADYETWYGWTHPHPELIDKFVYGLTEWFRNDIRLASHVANPGCFASAIQMGLLPFAGRGLVSECEAMGITGSSGSGATPSAGTHFSSRFGNVRAYKVYRHQHMGEVNQSLSRQIPDTALQPKVRFIPVSGPFVRGIWMTLSLTLNQDVPAEHVLEEEYYNAPMVRLRQGMPELKEVAGSAFTDIGFVQDGRKVVVGVAIDNLLKGAASQAVQNFNLMLELPEETGLMFPPAIV
ncbi:N-acetyl-gamma-glutamyl-phosphate reductase [Balneolales bacterium ANBcel1]|nr:N-acetyl-gamma-glutamyl-phosphate reductase [Balneolales bacterium ANBcel1]